MGEQGGLSRRDVLKLGGATGGLTATAGCLGWFRGGDGSDDETSDDERDQDETEQPANENENTEDETNADEEADPGGDTNESADTQDENDTSGDGNENESDTENETEEEQDPLTPDENETEVNESKYEDPEQAELTELEDSAADISLNIDLGENGASITGTITNACGCEIQSVDVDLEFYDAAGDYCGSHLITVRDLDPGESERVAEHVPPYDLQAVPHDATVLAVTVMGYA